MKNVINKLPGLRSKKIIVKLISILGYAFIIYCHIILLKPEHNDSITQYIFRYLAGLIFVVFGEIIPLLFLADVWVFKNKRSFLFPYLNNRGKAYRFFANTISIFVYYLSVIFVISTISDGVTIGDKFLIMLNNIALVILIILLPYTIIFNFAHCRDRLPIFRRHKFFQSLIAYFLLSCTFFIVFGITYDIANNLYSKSYQRILAENNKITVADAMEKQKALAVTDSKSDKKPKEQKQSKLLKKLKLEYKKKLDTIQLKNIGDYYQEQALKALQKAKEDIEESKKKEDMVTVLSNTRKKINQLKSKDQQEKQAKISKDKLAKLKKDLINTLKKINYGDLGKNDKKEIQTIISDTIENIKSSSTAKDATACYSKASTEIKNIKNRYHDFKEQQNAKKSLYTEIKVDKYHADDINQDTYSIDDLQKSTYLSLVLGLSNFTLNYSGENIKPIMNHFFSKIIHNGALRLDDINNSSDFDYLKCNLTYEDIQYTYTSDQLYISYYIDYNESADETKYVDKKVKSVLTALNVDSLSDYEKIKKIHDWILDHVSYDYTYNNYSAYDAVKYGATVCNGYSMLYYKMLTEAGIESRIITGDADNGEGTAKHAWNLVKLNHKWYYVDTTWDDGTESYKYFLVGSDVLNKDHFADNEYKTKDFNQYYNISSKSYSKRPSSNAAKSLLDTILSLF